MKPVVSGLDKKYGDRVAFANVDYSSAENAALLEKYQVLGHPTYVVLGADGKEVERFNGYTSETDLQAAIQKAAGSASQE